MGRILVQTVCENPSLATRSSADSSTESNLTMCSVIRTKRSGGGGVVRNNIPKIRCKWLLYSSTVILLSFILLSAVRPVECANEDTNDIGSGSRHVERIPGNNKASGTASGATGSGSAGSSNHDSNEVHSTSFRFPSTDEEEDEGSYEDEDASYYDHFGDSGELKPHDVEYLDYYEKEHPHQTKEKPQIAKCCPYGEAITADGKCKPFRSLEARHNQK